eukprot:16432496-Heterocapsa_arctica.AAC.1
MGRAPCREPAQVEPGWRQPTHQPIGALQGRQGSCCAFCALFNNDKSCAHIVCTVVAGSNTKAKSICHVSAVAIT